MTRDEDTEGKESMIPGLLAYPRRSCCEGQIVKEYYISLDQSDWSDELYLSYTCFPIILPGAL